MKFVIYFWIFIITINNSEEKPSNKNIISSQPQTNSNPQTVFAGDFGIGNTTIDLIPGRGQSKKEIEKIRNDLKQFMLFFENKLNKTSKNSEPTVESSNNNNETVTIPSNSTESNEWYYANKFFNLINPVKNLNQPSIGESIANSIKELANLAQELVPTLNKLLGSLPKTIEFTRDALVLSKFVTNDLPAISTSLPNSVQQLAYSLSKLTTNVTSIPSIARESTSKTLRSVPSEAVQVMSSIGALQSLVTETMPKTALTASSVAQSGVPNTKKISDSLSLMANAAKELPITAERVQIAINDFRRFVNELPEGKQLSDEVVEQLKVSLTKLPNIIKALPQNLKAITSIVHNLGETLSRTPLAVQKTIGVIPIIGEKNASEALDRIRLREKFEEKVVDEPEDEVLIGKSLLQNVTQINDETGLKQFKQNLALTLRKAMAALQASNQNSNVMTPVKPLVKSIKSLFDAFDKLKATEKCLSRATFDPLLGLFKILTQTVTNN